MTHYTNSAVYMKSLKSKCTLAVQPCRRQVNEPIADKPMNESIADETKFTSKRGLYNHYGIDVKTIPVGYEVKMRYVKINGKMGRLYKLVKK